MSVTVSQEAKSAVIRILMDAVDFGKEYAHPKHMDGSPNLFTDGDATFGTISQAVIDAVLDGTIITEEVNYDLDELATIFREHWHEANLEGRKGERVTDGLRAVLKHINTPQGEEV